MWCGGRRKHNEEFSTFTTFWYTYIRRGKVGPTIIEYGNTLISRHDRAKNTTTMSPQSLVLLAALLLSLSKTSQCMPALAPSSSAQESPDGTRVLQAPDFPGVLVIGPYGSDCRALCTKSCTIGGAVKHLKECVEHCTRNCENGVW